MKYLILLIGGVLTMLAVGCTSPQPGRETLNMNTDWAFYRGDVENGQAVETDDSGWIPVSVPHVMQLETKHCGGNVIYNGIGWYRRHFRLPAAYQGKRVTVQFEGVMKNCEVYLNGERITEHYGGYMGFVADLTGHIRWDADNVLAVKVDAADDPLTPPGKPQGRMDFYYYSGIYRDVRLVVTEPVYITDPLEENIVAGGGQFVTFPSVSEEEATVHVSTHVRNRTEAEVARVLVVELCDSTGHVVATHLCPVSVPAESATTTQQELTVRQPALWHPYTPYLYTLRTRLMEGEKVVDEVSQQIGIRTLRYTTEGFFLNGKPLYLRGANRHQAFPHIGDAAPNSMQERDVIQMKRGGYNAVRAAHYPADPAFLEACDRHGLLVVECIPGWQFYNPDSTFIHRLYEVGRQMIRRDRNHPSVVLWETALNESRYPVSLAKAIFELSHEEYPGDQFYTSGDYFGHADMEPYYDVFYKQVARFPKDGDVMSNYPEDFLAVKPLLTREWGDGVGKKPRVGLWENEEEQMRQCRGRVAQLEGKGYFDWCMLDANPSMAGHFLWSYNDYARGSQDETMYCGVVDMNRYPKFCYYLLQSMRSPSVSQPGLYEGPMVFIASHNASADYESSTSAIMVFSNCEEVSLWRNGKLVGTQTRAERSRLYPAIVSKGGSPLFVFDAGGYEAGTLKAEGWIDGRKVAEHLVSTSQAPARLTVEPVTEGIVPVADGSDLIPVYIKVCDTDGTLVSSSRQEIQLSVEGEGTLVGDTIARVGVHRQQAEGGVGFAFVRTSRKAGKIVVKAVADGLEAGEATVESTPYTGAYVPVGKKVTFRGHEEDHVVVKPSSWQQQVLKRPPLKIASVKVDDEQPGYPASNILDGDDHSWWIAGSDRLPQTVTFDLGQPTYIAASRILFQKDSSSYRHKVETSVDGSRWTVLYERECTGWEFKPMTVDREARFVRLIIDGVSEGRAGLGEVTFY